MAITMFELRHMMRSVPLPAPCCTRNSGHRIPLQFRQQPPAQWPTFTPRPRAVTSPAPLPEWLTTHTPILTPLPGRHKSKPRPTQSPKLQTILETVACWNQPIRWLLTATLIQRHLNTGQALLRLWRQDQPMKCILQDRGRGRAKTLTWENTPAPLNFHIQPRPQNTLRDTRKECRLMCETNTLFPTKKALPLTQIHGTHSHFYTLTVQNSLSKITICKHTHTHTLRSHTLRFLPLQQHD